MKLRLRQIIYIVLAVLAFALLILVVTNSQSPESLMAPPEASGAYKDIKKAIESSIDNGIILKAPNEGENTTAITFTDFNGDGENEAIAFYRIKNDDTSAIYMSVLLKHGSKWSACQPLKGKGNDVLEFSYGDLNYDLIPEVVVGWNMFDSIDNHSLCVYSLKMDDESITVKETDSTIYTKMLVDEVCNDGKKEILLIKNAYNDETADAVASVLELEDGLLKKTASVNMLKSVIEYKKMQSQKIGSTNVYYLDGVLHSGDMITEILFWDENAKALKSPTGDYELAIQTARKGTVCSFDINNDSIIEIPFHADSYDESDIIDWRQFELDGFRSVCRGMCSEDLNFVFPERWNNSIRVTQKENVRTFWDVSSGEDIALFDLVSCDLSSWQQLSKEYDKLKIHYGTIYGVKMYNSKSDLALSKTEIKNSIIDND